MASIKFDSTEICNGTYIPRFVKHESASLRELSLLELAGEDGAVLVSERYGVKYITLTGKLTAASRSALDTAIDSFKELFSRKEKNLDIEWEVGTRRYVATCVRHNFDRDHFHNLFVPWSAEFVIVKGIGEATTEIRQVNNQSFTGADYSSTVSFIGSAKPKPRIRLKSNSTISEQKGLSIENTDTDEKIVIIRPAGFGINDYFEVDCRLKTVKYAGVEISFNGVFPSFDIGANAYEIKIGEMLDQQFSGSVDDNDEFVVQTYWGAQSFMVPHKDETYQTIQLRLKKTGTPPNALVVEIQTDDGGKPSGTAVTNATFSIPESDVTTGATWVKAYSTNSFTLEANTKYWIVCKTTAGDAGNRYSWKYDSGVNATYKRGNRMDTDDSGVNWTDYPDDDFAFRLYYGGKQGQAGHTFYFDIYYYKQYL